MYAIMYRLGYRHTPLFDALAILLTVRVSGPYLLCRLKYSASIKTDVQKLLCHVHEVILDLVKLIFTSILLKSSKTLIVVVF